MARTMRAEALDLAPKRQPPSIDLTHAAPGAVMELCKLIVSSGVNILHGSSSSAVFHRLEPQQANDAAKLSGNRKGVYATVDVPTALAHAVLNRSYVTDLLSSYVFGQHTVLGTTVFRASGNLYGLFVDHDLNLFTDGHVYVLDARLFRRAADTQTEYHALDAQTPLLSLKVPRQLSELLFIVGHGVGRDTVLPYRDREIARISAYMRKMER